MTPQELIAALHAFQHALRAQSAISAFSSGSVPVLKHHNARPPRKVRKHERRERSAFKQSQRAWASRTFGQFVPCIPNQYPEPDGA